MSWPEFVKTRSWEPREWHTTTFRKELKSHSVWSFARYEMLAETSPITPYVVANQTRTKGNPRSFEHSRPYRGPLVNNQLIVQPFFPFFFSPSGLFISIVGRLTASQTIRTFWLTAINEESMISHSELRRGSFCAENGKADSSKISRVVLPVFRGFPFHSGPNLRKVFPNCLIKQHLGPKIFTHPERLLNCYFFQWLLFTRQISPLFSAEKFPPDQIGKTDDVPFSGAWTLIRSNFALCPATSTFIKVGTWFSLTEK